MRVLIHLKETTGSINLYDDCTDIAKFWWDSPWEIGVDNGFG